MTVAILVAISLPVLVRAQSGADTAPVILLHPRVATVLQLPDEIAHAHVLDRDELRVAIVGDKLYVRPRPGIPAGVEALLEVETRTARWTFRLLVVARASDASRVIRVPPVEAQAPEESTPEATLEVPAELPAPPLAVTPQAAKPATSAPSSAAPSAAPEPTEPEPTAPEPIDAPTAAPAAVTAMSSRLELSLHAFVGVGFAGLDVAGYEPLVGFQSLHAFGARLAVARPGAGWGLEASVSGERLAGPMRYENSGDSQLEVSGSWLRAEVSMRGRLVRNAWIPSASVGMGAQVHLRRTKGSEPVVGEREFPVSTIKYGAVLTLGIGLQYRVRDVLLGVEFQARQGSPNDYHAVEALWTVGYFLDQGE